MSEMDKGQKLFAAFPPVTTQQWEDKIISDLKGADYERKLIWKTNEGFNVRPYYRNEDLTTVSYLDTFPGQFPFVRGNKTENQWFIRQEIKEFDLKMANTKAIDLYSKGVNSFGFVLDNSKNYTVQDMAVLLNDLPLTSLEINFVAGSAALSVAESLIAFLKQKKVDLSTLKGAIVSHSMTCELNKGIKTSDAFWDHSKELILRVKELPLFKAVIVRGDVFENAGSSIVQELAFSLAAANECMAQLTNKGLPVDDVAKAIKFKFGVGSNYFMEIAKMRAARLLWAQLVKAYQPKSEKSCIANIHAVTSNWNKTIYDPYVNLLRTQTEAMSSVLGGVDSLTVNPFNAAYETPTEFSERIARNQQILLKEEAHFDKVVDPGAGSYYIETLTNNIAEQSWKLFLEVEDKGGYQAAVLQGFIQTQIKEMAQRRDLDIANRREILLGVNQYPNFNEKIDIAIEPAQLMKEAPQKPEIEPLVAYRGAMAFESLRYKTDQFAKTKKRPVVFMLTIGNLAMRKARAQFSSNFFAVAGFEVIEGKGYCEVADGIRDAVQAKADIIVVCSSDEEYATFAPQVKEMAGSAIIVVAGFPKEIMDALKAKGLEHFIHVKSNVLETLAGFQKMLGI